MIPILYYLCARNTDCPLQDSRFLTKAKMSRRCGDISKCNPHTHDVNLSVQWPIARITALNKTAGG